jgi:hypothetical protein
MFGQPSIFRGETRTQDKITILPNSLGLSLFEPSTEVIRKGKAARSCGRRKTR